MPPRISHDMSTFFQGNAANLDLHSFPTRRSSDLAQGLQVRVAIHICRQPGNNIDQSIRSADSVTNGFLTDRKSTRLNSSHVEISYAVFCLKKKRGVEPLGLLVELSRVTLVLDGSR